MLVLNIKCETVVSVTNKEVDRICLHLLFCCFSDWPRTTFRSNQQSG